MSQAADIEDARTLPAYWEEVLSAHLSKQPMEYHLVPMIDILKRHGNTPEDLAVRASNALSEHSHLGWKVLREACPETDDLLQKLGGVGQSSAYACRVMANVEHLITPERDEQITARIRSLVQTRYKAAYARLFRLFIETSRDYVSFLEKAAANAPV